MSIATLSCLKERMKADQLTVRHSENLVFSPPPAPPPELLKDSVDEEEEEEGESYYDEDDVDTLSTPSQLLSPKQHSSSYFHHHNPHNQQHEQPKQQQQQQQQQQHQLLLQHRRKKSVPHKSPSINNNDSFQIPLHNNNNDDKSVVFRLDVTATNPASDCISKIISGHSLLSSIRKQVANARLLKVEDNRIRKRVASVVEIPMSSSRLAFLQRRQCRTNSLGESQRKELHTTIVRNNNDHSKISKPKSSHHSGRPSRKKGPCQACQEASDGCMRKAFNWPFPSTQIFNDKGKPFVYLCNKCGLRYNKSGGAVCRHCRWVICKEEKRKAVHHIDLMRHNRPGDMIDPEEDIENFTCNPKYWSCGRPWKVGWVLNSNLTEEDDDTLSSVTST